MAAPEPDIQLGGCIRSFWLRDFSGKAWSGELQILSLRLITRTVAVYAFRSRHQ